MRWRRVSISRCRAGQQANLAAADSLTYASAVLDLEATLGMTSEAIEFAPTDSLAEPPAAAVPAQTLSEAAANFTVQSAVYAVRHEHRTIWSGQVISFGFEYGDPTHAEPGILPTFGLGFAIPLFDRNRGGIAAAQAEHSRAVAELALARIEARNQINHATRERAAALARLTRDRLLVASANSVASMSLTAYREGASTLPAVLEAQRTARDILAQYIDDLTAAWIATAELRALAAPVPAQSGDKP